MTYTAEKPRLPRPIEELKREIPGWGVDLEFRNRPAVPKENFNPGASGAHWVFPERQVERWPREKTLEHKFLTPVFGTACPPKLLSGAIRRHAYAAYSEGKMAHWLLLVLADRVDMVESRVEALLAGKPDNPLAESGLKAEITRHGLRSRRGQHRADLKHQPIDALFMVGTWAAVAGGAWLIGRSMVRAGRS